MEHQMSDTTKTLLLFTFSTNVQNQEFSPINQFYFYIFIPEKLVLALTHISGLHLALKSDSSLSAFTNSEYIDDCFSA